MRQEYETWFAAKFGHAPMPLDSRQIDFCWHGYQAGIESMHQQLAAKEEKRADLEFVWNGCEQQLATSQTHNVILREALEQHIDDMGEDGHCVCEAAKQQAIKALVATSKEQKK